MQIDPRLRGNLPRVNPPIPFQTRDGAIRGWKASIPGSRRDHHHYLAAFDLRGGRELWRQRPGGEIITAPVLAEGHIYLATLDGTLCCFRQDDGTPVWREAKNATSAPVVWQGHCYFSQ